MDKETKEKFFKEHHTTHGEQLAMRIKQATTHETKEDIIQNAPNTLMHHERRSSVLRAPRSYDSQSGVVFGILNQLLATFQQDLSDAQEKESNSKALYADVRAGWAMPVHLRVALRTY